MLFYSCIIDDCLRFFGMYDYLYTNCTQDSCTMWYQQVIYVKQGNHSYDTSGLMRSSTYMGMFIGNNTHTYPNLTTYQENIALTPLIS